MSTRSRQQEWLHQSAHVHTQIDRQPENIMPPFPSTGWAGIIVVNMYFSPNQTKPRLWRGVVLHQECSQAIGQVDTNTAKNWGVVRGNHMCTAVFKMFLLPKTAENTCGCNLSLNCFCILLSHSSARRTTVALQYPRSTNIKHHWEPRMSLYYHTKRRQTYNDCCMTMSKARTIVTTPIQYMSHTQGHSGLTVQES